MYLKGRFVKDLILLSTWEWANILLYANVCIYLLHGCVEYSILIGQSRRSAVCNFFITDRCYGHSSDVGLWWTVFVSNIDFLSKWLCNKRDNVQLAGHCFEGIPFRAMLHPDAKRTDWRDVLRSYQSFYWPKANVGGSYWHNPCLTGTNGHNL